MQMVIACTCVTRITNIGNYLTLARKFPWEKALRIALEMSVVKDQLLVRAELVDGCPTSLTLEKPNNLTVGRGEDRGSKGGWNIYSVVHASFGTRICKGVGQLLWPYAGDWDDQFQIPDKAIRDR
jgi:hypothetical protein